jgi:hypothetical protein
MGYTTYFSGSFEFDKPVTDELRNYINKFSGTRRMMRDNDMIKALYPNWKELCFNGELGRKGEYFVGGAGFAGQDEDLSIINYNMSDPQPGLWCQWVIEGDKLVWDEGEKFYDYVKWLEYLIKHFFATSGYILNGTVYYDGEDPDDFGKIIVTDNVVRVVYGKRVYGEVI